MTAADQGSTIADPSGVKTPPDQRSAVLMADALRKHLLLHQQMGIANYPQSAELQPFLQPRRRQPSQVPARPQSPPAAKASLPQKEGVSKPIGAVPPSLERQADLCRDLAACTVCGLATSRHTQVMGQGKIGAGLMIVGDYARTEDCDECLFGRGEDVLLWKMMQAIGLGPGDVYVTNVVKCSPAGEPAPVLENEQACQAYLHREIALVQPRIILVMGMSATRAVLGSEASVFRLRGRLHSSRFTGKTGGPISVMVSFHPHFLLEQPAMKKAAWQDLQIVQRQLQAAVKGTKVSR
ncbi:MAG: uracil-DNA glycosylase [Desulfobulbus sp.]|nr:uracil-DNA glycosylase [Desulfobulbus sp.]